MNVYLFTVDDRMVTTHHEDGPGAFMSRMQDKFGPERRIALVKHWAIDGGIEGEERQEACRRQRPSTYHTPRRPDSPGSKFI